MEGHRGFECPLKTGEHISATNTPGYYDQQRYERSLMYQDNRHTYDNNQHNNPTYLEDK